MQHWSSRAPNLLQGELEVSPSRDVQEPPREQVGDRIDGGWELGDIAT